MILSPAARRRAVVWFPLLLLVATTSTSGCGQTDVVVALHDQDAVRANAAWAELVVYPGGCRPASDTPPADAAFRAVVPADAEFPPVGELPKKTYGFAAILRNADCRILADGCQEANLERVGKINIFVVASNDSPAGCIGQCDAGTCRGDPKPPGTGGSGGAGGASNAACLTLKGEFPLPVANAPSSILTAPTILTTSTGFAVVYRDRAGTGGKDNVVVVPVGLDGAIAGTVQPAELPVCPGGAGRNDVGLGVALDTGAGLLLGDRPACTGDSEKRDLLAFLSLDPAGGLASLGQTRDDGARNAVTSGPSIVALKNGGRFGVLIRVSAQDDASEAPPLATKLLVVKPKGSTFEFSSSLTPVAGGAPTRFAVGAMLGSSELRVFTGLADNSLRMDRYDTSKIADDATVAVPVLGTTESLGPADRVSVASSELGVVVGQTAGKAVTLTTIGPSGAKEGLKSNDAAAPLSVAVAASKTHSFIARGTKGAVALSAFAASAPKTEIQPPAFTLPGLTKWSGEKLALGAGHDALLMAWTSDANGSSGAVGGYALFRCPATPAK